MIAPIALTAAVTPRTSTGSVFIELALSFHGSLKLSSPPVRGFVVTTSWFLATWSYVVPDLEEIIGLSDNTCVVNKIPALVANDPTCDMQPQWGSRG